jgi:hypothetical protein
LIAPSAEISSLNVGVLLEEIERLKRLYFFALGGQIRQAASFNAATTGMVGTPDLSRLYEECKGKKESWLLLL